MKKDHAQDDPVNLADDKLLQTEAETNTKNVQSNTEAQVSKANIARDVHNDISLEVVPLKKKAEESKALADQKAEELREVQEQVAEIVAKSKLEETNIDADKAQVKMDAVIEKMKAAIPAMEAAEAAVDCLSVRAIIDLGSCVYPPPGTELVTRAVLILRGVTN